MEAANLSKEEIGYIKNIANVFSQKWTFEIVFAIADYDGKIGFNELMKKLDGISAAVLSHRLKTLKKWGYVDRAVQAGPPTRTRYSLSEKGRSLIKVADFVVAQRGKTTFGPEMLGGAKL